MKILRENYEGLEEFAELPERLKNLLAELEIQKALKNSDFETLYREAWKRTSYNVIGEVTQLLISLNINPLDHLSSIPIGFLTNTSIKHLDIPDHITSISDSAFANCDSLMDVTIPDSVASIGPESFYNCPSLTSVTIPNTITKINHGTFFYCEGITSITIGNKVRSIDHSAFYHCSGLTSVTIPNSVKTIYNDAFCACNGLTSLTIGKKVVRIESRAFSDCNNLHDIRYAGTKDQWSKIHFEYGWNVSSPIKTIHCTDGDITL